MQQLEASLLAEFWQKLWRLQVDYSRKLVWNESAMWIEFALFVSRVGDWVASNRKQALSRSSASFTQLKDLNDYTPLLVEQLS